MDFVRLGPRYSTSYLPDKLIEGYNSLIWTERYQNPGEFELKTFDVDAVAKLIPPDTLVSHLETREVMMVETHSIDMVGEGIDAQPELTIKGRSAETILEHRWVESRYQKKRPLRKKYSSTAAIAVLMVNAIDNNSGADLTRGDDDPDTEGVVNHYDWNTKDVIPNVAITENVAVEGELRWWQVEEGILYPQIMDILIDDDLGIRCIRPVSPSPGRVITVERTLATRGTVNRTQVADITQLQFNIYKGIDRSNTVRISQLNGDLDKPQYLESYTGYKTAVEIMSGTVGISDIYRPGESGLTGWRRRTMPYDAGEPDIPAEPERPKDPRKNATAEMREEFREDLDKWRVKHAKWEEKRDRIIADFKEENTKKATNLLKKARKVDMFAGEVSTYSEYKYGKDYFLGDTIKLVGDYDKKQKMVVYEYIRTEDAEGDRGIPGLVLP